MDKLKKILPVVLVCLALAGCAKQNENSVSIKPSGELTDGTYTETAKGKKGNFDVTVIIRNGVIAEVRVGDNNETPDIGGIAVDQLPQKIVEEQSCEVDAVSGATITSDGIRAAVRKALQRASWK